MVVEAGYRKTEIGIIPSDWDVIHLGSIGIFSKGNGIKKDETASGDIPCVRYGEIYTHHNDIVRYFNSWISSEVAQSSKRIKKADILFAGSGETKEEIGKCVAFIGDEEAYAGGDVVILTPNKGSSSYLGYLLNAPMIAKQKASRGQGDAVVHISASALSTILIPLPPTKAEQEAIAQALSDADTLIESLEGLIAKKRDIKKGAMQELLTGKKRLSGFSKKWKLKRLGDLSEMGSGGTPLTSISAYYDGDIPWVSITDMTEGGKFIFFTARNLSPEGFANSAAQMFPEGTVLYAMYASLGECSIAGKSLCSSQAILGIRPKNRLNNEFLYYYLNSIKANVKNMGQQGTQANLNKGMVQAFELRLPPLPEQNAIVTILSDMDADIAALETKLTKIRQIKQGMMQNLLTGRIRLV